VLDSKGSAIVNLDRETTKRRAVFIVVDSQATKLRQGGSNQTRYGSRQKTSSLVGDQRCVLDASVS
jgi:hypothetical protein